ncbi:TetR/AcrR family transcriptional regulator [Actinoplanes regularis]|uniref:Transcriptional regulator, TetR family n=1 Tax=Actinoplanes regularis TaxID=52697 RepID=A0A239DN45_9ACTN|nr:TetR/AcrR family transcriptional regulator [Actinoplanes regularis]GIE89081.1 TetR family transcriptional regulator [Actinoplanes regularis]SNS34035.1 transcriptional regulator, TetR family [Actinoplanes regularis]
MSQRSGRVDSRRTDTRERAVTVALELFARQGYTATSLREIAERLGVTKAALYFHFRTKEEILTAILRGYLDGVTTLVEAAEGPDELIRGFAAHQRQWGIDLVLLVWQNYTEIQDLPIGAEIRQTMRSLVDTLAPAGADPAQRLRVRIALSTFQIAAVTALVEDDDDEASLREAALGLSLELLRGADPGTREGTTTEA